HIPGIQNQLQIFRKINKLLSPIGIAIISFWRFLDVPRLASKVVPSDKLINLGIEKGELDQNDYILDWDRGVSAYRYCHYYSDDEINYLVKESKFNLLAEYFADGKEGKGNKYIIISK
ncbi:MAG: hypothetical protein KDC90_16625, partial [Ignavibacteriae bacterium]|nr:hypothetical protein [Ignavibacteriota bacterium]